MISVTRINHQRFVLNCELIKFIEETPDTIITLVNNEKIVVSESADAIVDKVIEFGRRQRIFCVEG